MTRTLAAELAPFNIRVNAYIPVVIKTDLTRSFIEKSGSELVKNIALNRLGEPEDVAEV
jgi:3-oxoacyl-[acyl-carrier protein] reductase